MSKFQLINSVSEMMRFVIKGLYPNQGLSAIDATCGNGNDTLFLSKYFKTVYAFDIQKEAIEKTSILLKDNNIENAQLFLRSNEYIDELFEVDSEIEMVVYNLGYLPGGDKSLSTNSKTTILSISKALKSMKNGFVLIALYPGHIEGMRESIEVLDFVKSLDTKIFAVMHFDFINRPNNPPNLVVIEKRGNNGK